MSRDAHARAVEFLELRRKRRGQLARYVAIHVVVLGVGGGCGVEVEAGALGKVVGVVVGDGGAARGGVGEDEGEIVGGGVRDQIAFFLRGDVSA